MRLEIRKIQRQANSPHLTCDILERNEKAMVEKGKSKSKIVMCQKSLTPFEY